MLCRNNFYKSYALPLEATFVERLFNVSSIFRVGDTITFCLVTNKFVNAMGSIIYGAFGFLALDGIGVRVEIPLRMVCGGEYSIRMGTYPG